MTTKNKRARQDARHGARSRKALPARATAPQGNLRAVAWRKRKLEPAIAEMLAEMLAVAVQLAVAESELQRSRHSGE